MTADKEGGQKGECYEKDSFKISSKGGICNCKKAGNSASIYGMY